MGFKEAGMKIMKRGAIIGGTVARSLIGIGAAVTLLLAVFRRKKRSGK